MQRIKPEAVVKAFRKLGALMIVGTYHGRIGGHHCYCGLGALVAARGKYVRAYNQWIVQKELGITFTYHNGFTSGFDGGPRMSRSGVWNAGYRDGSAARKLCLKAKIPQG